MAEVRIKDMDEHEIDTILAEDIDFEGHLTFKKPLMIKGRFKGEIRSTSALYIGEKAMVEATTEAALISSRGRHKGNIVAHTRVELASTAQVDGDITTPDFVMESGCRFNGHCAMGGRKDEQPSAQNQAPQATGPAQPAAHPQGNPPPHGAAVPPQNQSGQPRPAQAHGPGAPPHGQQNPGAQK